MTADDPDYPVRVWLERELAKRGHGAKSELASHLGITGTQLGRMLPGSSERRRIEAGLLLKMQHYFGSMPDLIVEEPAEGEAAA